MHGGKHVTKDTVGFGIDEETGVEGFMQATSYFGKKHSAKKEGVTITNQACRFR